MTGELGERWHARIRPQPIQGLLHRHLQQLQLPSPVPVVTAQESLGAVIPGELRPAASTTLFLLMPIDLCCALCLVGLELRPRCHGPIEAEGMAVWTATHGTGQKGWIDHRTVSVGNQG